MPRKSAGILAVVAQLILAVSGARVAAAQGPTLEGASLPPGSEGSLLGPSPGALQGPISAPSPGILGGRPGAGFSRVPTAIATPGGRQQGRAPELRIAPPPILPPSELPASGSLGLPGGAEDEGPANGLSLDMAIERLVRENPTLKAQALEIPQAQADILTASLRANPIFYADSQLVPYGSYSPERPGGATQYDVNVSIPIDVSGKRSARMAVAGRAKQVLEAQYQDAVRLQIDNLYTAFVDVLAARQTVRFTEAGLEGYEAVLETLQERLEKQLITPADVNRVRIQRDLAGIARQDALETLAKSMLLLAELLNLPRQAVGTIAVRGQIGTRGEPPATGEELVAMALRSRPDLAAFRLGVERARAEVGLAEANKWSDIYWLVQPYTFQDLSPFGLKSAHSWAMGVTVALPIRNRNQGNIQRARINVAQSCAEITAVERAVATEVLQAEKDFQLTRAAVTQMEAGILPAAEQVLETTRLNFEKGEIDAIAWLAARSEFNGVIRQYRDMLVRQRRSGLRLNTVVGRRILP